MNKEEVEKVLGQFGMITVKRNGWIQQIHGKPKEIDAEDMLLFKDTSRCLRKFRIHEIVTFEVKDMLPEPTEHKGKPITWDNGRGFINKFGKEIDLNR